MVSDTIIQSYITIIPREKHIISRKNISKNALKVLYRLNKCGYEAYLVGGGVRDLLLGKKPKDFDITTSATPEQIRKIFHNCRLVGRRFRLAHIIFNSEIIEVTTFRAHHENSISNQKIIKRSRNGMLLWDNIFGSVEEDAKHRDFTINSLYYSVIDFTIRDYIGGIHDLKKGLIRFLDNPETRYREDPVRMLRAVRFSAKLSMYISPETADPIPHLAGLISNVSSARLFEETSKLFQTGHAYKTYKLLRRYKLFQLLFPTIIHSLTKDDDNQVERIIIQALKKIDSCVYNNVYIGLSLLFSAIFWYPMLKLMQSIIKKRNLSCYDACSIASKNILNEACRSLAIPKYIVTFVRDIWQLQFRMSYYQRKRVRKLMEHPKFHIAYDLLFLRAKVEKNSELQCLVEQWNKVWIATLQKKKKTQNISNSSSKLQV